MEHVRSSTHSLLRDRAAAWTHASTYVVLAFTAARSRQEWLGQMVGCDTRLRRLAPPTRWCLPADTPAQHDRLLPFPHLVVTVYPSKKLKLYTVEKDTWQWNIYETIQQAFWYKSATIGINIYLSSFIPHDQVDTTACVASKQQQAIIDEIGRGEWARVGRHSNKVSVRSDFSDNSLKHHRNTIECICWWCPKYR